MCEHQFYYVDIKHLYKTQNIGFKYILCIHEIGEFCSNCIGLWLINDERLCMLPFIFLLQFITIAIFQYCINGTYTAINH